MWWHAQRHDRRVAHQAAAEVVEERPDRFDDPSSRRRSLRRGECEQRVFVIALRARAGRTNSKVHIAAGPNLLRSAP
jgi:hypothetical protein